MDVAGYNEKQQIMEQLVGLIFFFFLVINSFIVKGRPQGKLEKHTQCMDLVQ